MPNYQHPSFLWFPLELTSWEMYFQVTAEWSDSLMARWILEGGSQGQKCPL